MPAYEVELSSAAVRDLKSLPAKIQKEIVWTHLPAIEENPYAAGKPLVGTLHRERSYHFGRKPEYRIIYFIEGKIITVTVIGTRQGIYKTVKKRR